VVVNFGSAMEVVIPPVASSQLLHECINTAVAYAIATAREAELLEGIRKCAAASAACVQNSCKKLRSRVRPAQLPP